MVTNNIVIGATNTEEYDNTDSSNSILITFPYNMIFGDSDDNILKGAKDTDYILGYDGDDKLAGRSGDDYLSGGNGNDKLIGGNGDDKLSGGSGNDKIIGGRGDDFLDGGEGADKIFANKGNDTIFYNSLLDSTTDARDKVHGFTQGEDIFDFSELGLSFEDNIDLTETETGNTLIKIGDNFEIEVIGDHDLTSSDFIF